MEAALVTQLVAFNYSTLPDGGFELPQHLHHYFQFDVILSGEVDILIENQKPVRAKAGFALLIPPLVRHGYRASKSYRQGSFKFHLAPRYWGLFGASIRRAQLPTELLKSVEVCGRRYNTHSPLAEQQAAAVLTLCLAEFVDTQRTAPIATDGLDSFRGRLWPLLERIEQHPRAQWSVAKMASECRLSVGHFSKRFRAILRQTPQQYLLEARMRAGAAALLAEPPQPIKEIAETAGYATVHSFSRAFKAIFQTSPAAYRKNPPQF